MMVNHQHHSKADVNKAEKQNIIAQAFHEVECFYPHFHTMHNNHISSLDQTRVRRFGDF